MKNNYLWDPSGPPDPEVQRLEALLGRLRSTPPLPRLPELPAQTRASNLLQPAVWTIRYLGPSLAAAAAVLMMIALTWSGVRRSSWQVARVEGEPRIESMPLGSTGRMTIGQTLVTDNASRARLQVSTIGSVTVEPASRVRLVDTRAGRHQLALDRGTLTAVITAPPGQFIVDTPSATATDLGCSYTLHVDEDGASLLSVSAGWVALDAHGRESFVPAGASCRTHPTVGPGTPWYDDEPQLYKEALDQFDFGDAATRAEGIRYVLAHSGHGDAVTLWHLLSRVDAADRPAVVDALADQVAMPIGVTREAIQQLDRAALDRWWEALGLGDASWWRKWKNW